MINSDLNIEKHLNKLNVGMASIKLAYNNEKKPVDLIFTDVDEGFERIFGLKKATTVGKSYSKINSQMNEEVVKIFDKAARNNTKETFEYYENIRKRHITVSLYPEEDKLTAIFQDITDIIRLGEKNKRINKIIRASRIINKLILKEKELSILLKKSCEIIAASISSPIVWISSLSSNGTSIIDNYSSNNEVLDQLDESKNLTPCMKDTLEYKKAKLYSLPTEVCNNCRVNNRQNFAIHLLAPIKFNNTIYGILNIRFDTEMDIDKSEFKYFEDIAEDLGYYIFNIEIKDDLEIARRKVRQYYNEIDHQNKELLELNKELKAKNEQLEIAKEKALESERLKSAFLSNVSHELRTPLNGILGFTQLIKQPNTNVESLREYLEIIHQSGNNLLDAINSILDISKIESNQLSLHLHEFELKKIILDTVTQNKAEGLEQSEVAITTQTDALPDHFKFVCDEYKVRQILDILIRNAIKFTKKGEIRVGAYPENEDIVIFVKDTGIGIDSQKFESIFENFIQVDDTHTREFGGIGLGLPIAKGLVNILNGHIWLESEVGKGSTFYFKIPYIKDSTKTEKENRMDFKEISNLDWSSKKILIVEDDSYSAEYLAEALGITNVQIIFANNGKEAIEMVKEHPDINVVLMDIQLPDLSGDKATSIIRESNVDIPIIAQTAHAMVNDKESYLSAGCTDYIAKPISVKELFTLLNKYI
ncbi:MAG: response regulator [Bacteroidetes bacterium]|nr:response regulator [Bacteroidota bacterium]